MAKLTKEEVLHIAHLSRLKLSENEEEMFSEQLASIIEYVGQLNELELSGVSPTAQSIGIKNVMRKDVVEDFGHKSAIVKNAPSRVENFFKVKKVIE